MYNNPRKQRVDNRNISFNNYSRVGQWSIVGTLVILIFLLTVSLSVPLGADLQLTNVRAAIDIDVSGNGKAAASDGEESIATDGDSFCSITDDIAGGKFSSLFEGIVDCDDSQVPNQFLVEYSYTKNPVKIGEKTYLIVTVKDKDTGNPISNAFVSLAIGPPSASYEASAIGTAVAAAGTISTQEEVEERTTQAMYTDNNGRATFTLQVGPKSNVGIYDTELDVRKDNYQSSFEQVNFQVV